MVKAIRIALFYLMMLLVLASCSQLGRDSKQPAAFQYGMVLTSYTKELSSISLLDKNFKEVSEFTLPFGGLAKGKQYNNHYYIPVTGIPSSSKDQTIIDFNLQTEKITFIKTLEHPVDLAASKGYLYIVHNTAIDSGEVAKINLKTRKIIQTIKLKGVLKRISIQNGIIMVVGDDVKGMKQYIHLLSMDLKLKMEERNPYTAFPTEIVRDNQSAYIVNNAKNNFTGPADTLVQYSLLTKQFKQMQLKAEAPWELLQRNHTFYMTYLDFTRSFGSKVSVSDTHFTSSKIFLLKNIPELSLIKGEYFLSCDGHRLYVYHLKDFTLVKKIGITDSNMFVTGVFMNM
jgi:hypothetical protein